MSRTMGWGIVVAVLLPCRVMADVFAGGSDYGAPPVGAGFPSLLRFAQTGDYTGLYPPAATVHREGFGGLTRGPDGNLYFLGNILGIMAIFRANVTGDGSVTTLYDYERFAAKLTTSSGIAFDPAGRLYVVSNEFAARTGPTAIYRLDAPGLLWSPEHVPAARAAFDSPPKDPQARLGLYLHIPFCRKRCKFCYFRVYTDKNADEVETYLSALSREIALYANREGFGGRQFEFVYFGGGTPSFLSNAQLERMIERINQNWTWDAAKEVTFECEPGTLKESKLQTIKKIGVTRLSLGVEHFDDEILSSNGRAHKSPEIFRAYDWIRQVGFKQVNIDLIAGMLGETDDKWKMAVEKAIAMDPDSVTIYQMEVPFNTGIAKATKEHGDVETPIASWAQKRAWVDYAFRQFGEHGYEVSSAYTMVKKSTHAGFVYRDSLWRGADLVGTGVASFGHFQGVHYQNLDKWEDYIEALDRGELPINRALPVTPHQKLIREMILLMKTGKLDAGYFRQKFGVEILREFAEGFSSLVSEGFAEIAGDGIRLTRDGLLRVDSLLPRFFEPEHRNVRYT